MDMARRALDALEFAGIDAGRISLEGGVAQQAADDANISANTVDRDKPMVEHIVWRVVIWGIAGAIVGAIAGLIFEAIGVEVVPAVGDSIAVAMLSYALLGLIIGALVGGMSGISQGEGWELTVQPQRVDGNVFVAVHSNDQKDIQRAEQVLRTKDALSVSQYDERGKALST
jgi:outer membrane lipoprotein SlyB